MKKRILSSVLTWEYDGPIYFGTKSDNEYVTKFSGSTRAETKSKALSNLRYQAASYIDTTMIGLVQLDMRYLNSTGYPDNFDLTKYMKPVCPNCGETLTDSGLCPYCDIEVGEHG